MSVETKLAVTLDAAPESSAEGPWAADVVTHTHGVEVNGNGSLTS